MMVVTSPGLEKARRRRRLDPPHEPDIDARGKHLVDGVVGHLAQRGPDLLGNHIDGRMRMPNQNVQHRDRGLVTRSPAARG